MEPRDSETDTMPQSSFLGELHRVLAVANRTYSTEISLPPISEDPVVMNIVNRKLPISTFECCPDSKETYTIRLEHITNKAEVRKMECGHVFHSKCLLEWVNLNIDSRPRRNPQCPNCNTHLGVPISFLSELGYI